MKIKAKIQGHDVEIYSVMYMYDGRRYATVTKDIDSVTVEPDSNK